MDSKKTTAKIILVAILIAVITGLHILTSQEQERFHVFFRELYFLPLILAAFWFGLRGALITSLTITACYLPYTILNWQSFSPDDLDRLFEIGLFNIIGPGLGLLRDREKIRVEEKHKAILAMAAAVAHEMNSPLFAALGTAQLIQDDFEPESEPYKELQLIINNLKTLSSYIKKTAGIDKVEMKTYVGDSVIMDIEKSINEKP